MAKIGFIGMGNMGYAMLKGLLKTYSKEDILFSCASYEKKDKINSETGVKYTTDNITLARESKYIILAIKPVIYDKVIKEILPEINSDKIIISLSPIHTISALNDLFMNRARIVRSMPNTPALVGVGMTGICYDFEQFTYEENCDINKFFNSFGSFRKLEEKHMNAVTCASGSSPAYVYMFIEALADAVVKHGMPWADAYDFVTQAVIGAATMVKETGEHPASLRDKVCSPGGTTIAGVAALEEYGFRNAIIKAVDSCFDKCVK